eukprot:CAMPEP_0172511768 /NCGR_PEP_ID=MMETSP1066-20121228/238809_1 /TAXON_ID=671091 /ORGANISM="Coscinodiscus wailesii, Strain CCMP2513" /LENGTH=205 /DNA_ID=CAMNT_0013291289 /DNA_START=45 /DNA_END=659 /DNA_ORIENTATION=-
MSTPAEILEKYETAVNITYASDVSQLPNPRAEEQAARMNAKTYKKRMLEECMTGNEMKIDDTVDHMTEWLKLKNRNGDDESIITVRMLYPCLGWVLIRDLSQAFYDSVWSDNADWFRKQFQRDVGKEEEVMNQWTFFVEHFGGPNVFEAWRNAGGEDLVEFTHTSQQFVLTKAGLKRWLCHMAKAMRKVGLLEKCPEAIPIMFDW